MSESAAELVVTVVLAYASVGVVLAAIFLSLGAKKIDHSVRGSTRGFYAVVFPGAVALWPVLLVKWARGSTR